MGEGRKFQEFIKRIHPVIDWRFTLLFPDSKNPVFSQGASGSEKLGGGTTAVSDVCVCVYWIYVLGIDSVVTSQGAFSQGP